MLRSRSSRVHLVHHTFDEAQVLVGDLVVIRVGHLHTVNILDITVQLKDDGYEPRVNLFIGHHFNDSLGNPLLTLCLKLEGIEHVDSMTEHRDLQLLLVLEMIHKLLLCRLLV